MFIDFELSVIRSPLMGESDYISLLKELHTPLRQAGSRNISPLRGFFQIGMSIISQGSSVALIFLLFVRFQGRLQ
ncbi:MAG: hypothetical protein ACREBC_12420 [Pyrinomonadaceae bacterium]